MLQAKNLSIGTKLKIFTSLLTIAIVITFVAISSFLSSEEITENSLRWLEKSNVNSADKASIYLKESKNDVLFLSKLPSLVDIINIDSTAIRQDTTGVLATRHAENLAKTIDVFTQVALAKKIYMQLRYLDESGKEVVRVDSKLGKVKVIPQEKLQNKGSRGYFKETMDLEKGDIFVSELNLNRENGKVEIPHNPVIRYAIPLFDRQNNRKGIVIANVFASSLFADLEVSNKQGDTYLINNLGNFMINTEDPSLQWGAELEHNGNFQNSFHPSVSKNILSDKPYIGIDHGFIFSSYPIFPLETDKSYYLIIVNRLSEDTVLQPIATLIRILMIIGTISGILAVLVSHLFSKTICKPLVKLEKTVDDLFNGKATQQIAVDSEDEVGRITHRINHMTESIHAMGEFASHVGQGDFYEKEQFETKMGLAKSLLKMRDSLKETAEEDKQRNWITESLSTFNNLLMSSNESLKILAQQFISQLTNHVEANQARLFLVNDDGDEPFLELITCYAWNRNKYIRQHIQKGEGLAGQVWVEASTIYLSKVPKGYIDITSGSGSEVPSSLIILPLKIKQDVLGVLEMAFFKPLTHHEKEFLEKLTENMASTLSSMIINRKTQELLEKSQLQSEALRAQEEEMRQNQEELQAIQEDMQRKREELEEEVAMLKNQLVEANYNKLC